MTAREYLQKVGLSPMSADRFAQRALHGVVRNKAIIVVPRSAKAIWYLHRLSPGLIDLTGRSTARRILKDLPDTRLSISQNLGVRDPRSLSRPWGDTLPPSSGSGVRRGGE